MFRSPWKTAGLLMAASLLVAATISILRPPVPRVHDEFAYLLAGDTFAHGRLTNPTHPLWRHFETIHVIQQPSYASKYPPGQGAMLAIGQVLADWPIVGVWLTTALATVSCYWMLLAFVPRRWAALGGASLLITPGFQLTWGQTYWGGTLAFAGGALVLGAASRLVRPAATLRVRDSIAMASGAIVLAVTRPFEGLVLCLFVGAWIAAGWLKHGPPAMGDLFKRLVLPQLAVLLAGGLALGSYNQAVTGSALTMPYKVHEGQYGMCPLFLFGEPTTDRNYAHDSLWKFHAGWSMDWFDRQQTWWGMLETKADFLYCVAKVLLPLPLLMPAFLLPWWRGRKLRIPLLLLVGTWLVTQIAIWNWPHYIAPVAPVVVLLAIYGLRNLRFATRDWSWSGRSVQLLVATQAIVFVAAAVSWVQQPCESWESYRQYLTTHLYSQPGKHLVLVEYTPLHDPLQEWVYNGADIDQERVVWAHSMSAEQNAELIQYFGDRKVWRLAADMPRPVIAPFERSQHEVQVAHAIGD